MTPSAPKLAYGPEAAAEQLGVSRARFYQLVKEGKVRTYKDGKRRLCSHQALIECQQEMERASIGSKPHAAACLKEKRPTRLQPE